MNSQNKNIIQNIINSSDTDFRKFILLFNLIEKSDYQTIQLYADEMHVSRSTFEIILRDLRRWLTPLNIEIESGNKGIRLNIQESIQRFLLVEYLNSFWKGFVILSEAKNQELKLSVSFDSRLEEFIKSEEIRLLNEIILNHLNNAKITLTETQHKSILLGLYIAVYRIKQGRNITKYISKHPEISAWSEELIDKIEQELRLKISMQERFFINDLIADQLLDNMKNLQTKNIGLLEYGRQIEIIINETLSELQPDKLLILNLVTHLNNAIQRLKLGIQLENPQKSIIRQKYNWSFSLGIDMSYRLEEVFEVQVNSDEISFIAMHIQAFLERNTQKKVDIVLITSLGFGAAKLLEQRMINTFKDRINIKQVVGLSDLPLQNHQDFLIISTLPLINYSGRYIQISQFLTDDDIHRIDNVLEKQDILEDEFTDLLDEDLIYISGSSTEDRSGVISFISFQLIARDYCKLGVLESVIAREQKSSTAIGTVAIPHGETKFTNQSKIVLYINPKGISWGRNTVNLVVFLALKPSEFENADYIFAKINQLVEDHNLLKNIIDIEKTSNNKKETIMKLMNEGRLIK